MPELSLPELTYRKDLARALLSRGEGGFDEDATIDALAPDGDAARAARLAISFPDGLNPIPRPLTPEPRPGQPLPVSDVVVVTWTADEHRALADVLTPGRGVDSWYDYDRLFAEHYDLLIRKGAPAKRSRRLGSYFPTMIGDQRVLCLKSELHLNQDGIEVEPGKATLPVKDLFLQIINECQPKVILTVGTCGGIDGHHDLGDVLVTRAARFRCKLEFANAPYNEKTFSSDWQIPVTHFATARELMNSFASHLTEPTFGPPTTRHQGQTWTLPTPYRPTIVHEGGTSPRDRIAPLDPILTTDFFEFGTSANAAELLALGCGVEMGDAALGLAASEIPNPPAWAVVRNLSDPQISGELPSKPRAMNMQAHWAVWYYDTYDYWTSVMSAITTWAIVAGLTGPTP